MDAGAIIVIAVAAIMLGVGVYFYASDKKNIAKAIWVGLAGFIGATSLAYKNKVKKIKQNGQDVINDSKKEDENRKNVIEKTEDRIKKNKELLDEINKILGSN